MIWTLLIRLHLWNKIPPPGIDLAGVFIVFRPFLKRDFFFGHGLVSGFGGCFAVLSTARQKLDIGHVDIVAGGSGAVGLLEGLGITSGLICIDVTFKVDQLALDQVLVDGFGQFAPNGEAEPDRILWSFPQLRWCARRLPLHSCC